MRRLGRRVRTGETTPEVNIAPLLDVVFILLIFFVVTTVFVEETGVDVERPTAASAEQLQKQSLLIAITSDGRIVYGGQEFGLGGLRALVARELMEREVPVIILVDREAHSGSLVDVIDECKLAGAKIVSVAAGREES
jgi:biopolymer transport protein ExbD